MEDSKLDKIIKTLEYCTTSEDCRPCEYWQTFDDTGCQCMKDALELLKEQPKWTSVKERYPDKEGFYLVSADHGNYHPWIAEMRIFCGVKGFCNGANMPCVGAWMPLPEPYVNDNYLR